MTVADQDLELLAQITERAFRRALEKALTSPPPPPPPPRWVILVRVAYIVTLALGLASLEPLTTRATWRVLQGVLKVFQGVFF